MADWAIQACGIDPIADVRGTYSTEKQFLRIVYSEGGFEFACSARLAAIGMIETARPMEGDLMVVLAPYAKRCGPVQRRATGAICVSEKMRAVITSDMGIVIAGNDALPMLRAWTFG